MGDATDPNARNKDVAARVVLDYARKMVQTAQIIEKAPEKVMSPADEVRAGLRAAARLNTMLNDLETSAGQMVAEAEYTEAESTTPN